MCEEGTRSRGGTGRKKERMAKLKSGTTALNLLSCHTKSTEQGVDAAAVVDEAMLDLE